MFGRNLLVLFPLLFLAVASPVPAEDKRSHGHGMSFPFVIDDLVSYRCFTKGSVIKIIDTSMLTGGRLSEYDQLSPRYHTELAPALDEVLGEARIAVVGN